jgi:monoamine oxidase
MRDAVVIGGGLAGLTAAMRLSQAGVQLHIFEARVRTGGRIRTHQEDVGGVQIELGGELIGARHTSIRRLCCDMGIVLNDCGSSEDLIPDSVVLSHRRLPQTQVLGLRRELDALIDHLSDLATGVSPNEPWRAPKVIKQLGMISVENWMAENRYSSNLISLFSDLPPHGQSVLALLALISGVGARAFFHDNERLIVEGGTRRIIEGLANILGDRIECGCRVDAVEQIRGGVRLSITHADGSKLEADARSAIIALPHTALSNVKGLQWFHKLIAPSMSQNQKMTVLSRTNNVSGRRWPVCLLTDQAHRIVNSSRMETTDGRVNQRIDVLIRPLGKNLVIPSSIVEDVLALCDLPADSETIVIRSGWSSDPFSLGSYAFFGPHSLQQTIQNVQDGSPPFFFAGDYILPGFAGYMEGAVRSGTYAAQNLLAYLAGRPNGKNSGGNQDSNQ